MVKRLFPVALLFVLSSFIIASCGLFDQVKIEITSPKNNIRITDEVGEGVTPYVDLRVDYTGSKATNIAEVYVNGQSYGQCTLYIGNNLCGTYPLSNQNSHQNFTVQVKKTNGELVTTETNFVWKPYSFTEKLVNNTFGTETNLTLVFAIIAVVVVSVLIAKVVNGGIGGVILSMWVTSGIAAMVMSQYGALAGIITLNKFFAFWGGIAGSWVFMQIILAMVNKGYQFKIGAKQANYTNHNGAQFNGSSAGMSIGPGQEITKQEQSDPFAAAFKIAETEANSENPYSLPGAFRGQQRLKSGVKHTTTTNPGFFTRLFFGKKPEVIEYEE